jgi:hypothetical protein
MQAPASSSCLGFAADITHTCMLLKSNNMAVSCAPCVTSPASLQIRLPQSTVESQPPLSPPGGRSYVMLQLQAYPITPSAAADFSLFPWDNASSCLSWGRRPGPSRDGQHRSPAGSGSTQQLQTPPPPRVCVHHCTIPGTARHDIVGWMLLPVVVLADGH